jgi:hypothetical protein
MLQQQIRQKKKSFGAIKLEKQKIMQKAGGGREQE